VTRLLVSTIIPTYNRATLVARAIQSALGQSGDGDEVIVVDDGSTDNTPGAVSPYLDRIRYIQMENLGAGAARNRGIREAKNDLIAFLDSDDEWMPHGLELKRNLLAALPNVLFAFSDFAVRNRRGQSIHNFLPNWHMDSRGWDEILGPGTPYSSVSELPAQFPDFKIHVGNLYDSEFKASYIFTSTVVVRRREAGQSLRFAEDTSTYEDWACFGRLAGKGLGVYLDCETAWQHGDAGERLTDANRYACALARISILDQVWGSDPAFLARHGREFHALRDQQRLIVVAEMLRRGQTSQARTELRTVEQTPLSYFLMASLPGAVVSRALKFRQALIRWRSGR
jgi:glycosyltransferase involved in cell wall biosynthesis